MASDGAPLISSSSAASPAAAGCSWWHRAQFMEQGVGGALTGSQAAVPSSVNYSARVIAIVTIAPFSHCLTGNRRDFGRAAARTITRASTQLGFSARCLPDPELTFSG